MATSLRLEIQRAQSCAWRTVALHMNRRAAPPFTPYLGQSPSYDYIWEQLTAQGLELVVVYCDYGELLYRINGSWGVEVENGIERVLTSRESAHMRWPENLRPGQPFRVLPNDVVRWLWQQLSLANLRATQLVTREASRNDRNHYHIVQAKRNWSGRTTRTGRYLCAFEFLGGTPLLEACSALTNCLKHDPAGKLTRTTFRWFSRCGEGGGS